MKSNQKAVLPLTPRSGGTAFSAMIIIYMILTVLFQAVLGAISVSETLYTAICALVAPISILIVLLVSGGYSKRNISYAFSVKGCNPLYFVVALTFAGGMLFGLGFVNGLISSGLSKLGVTVSSLSLDLSSVKNLVIFSVVLALVPAVFEELFFRGLMFNSLSGAKAWQSVLFVSVCFALYHLSATQFLYQLIYGALLCVLAYASKSVLPCVFAHFLNNFTILLLTYLQIEIDLYNGLIILLGVVLLAVSAVLTIAIMKNDGKEREENRSSDDIKEFWLPTGLFGSAICLVLIISGLFVG